MITFLLKVMNDFVRFGVCCVFMISSLVDQQSVRTVPIFVILDFLTLMEKPMVFNILFKNALMVVVN